MSRPQPASRVAPSARLDIRVMPRSSRAGFGGLRDGRLVVRVTAPPVDDAANTAVVAAVAAALSRPRQDVRIVAGAASRNKTLEIRGLTDATLHQWLTHICRD